MNERTSPMSCLHCPVDGCCSVRCMVPGEPASKANSRQFVKINGIPRIVKSPKALAYVRMWNTVFPEHRTSTDPKAKPLYESLVRIYLKIYYRTRRPDLDESLILDLLQNRFIKNDRQVREKHIYWSIDKDNPRSEFILTPLEGCHCDTDVGCLLRKFRTEEGCC